MSFYAKAIAAAIDSNDEPTVALVEEIMRTDRTGLDGLSAAQFSALARRSARDVTELHLSGELTMYCDALGLTLPSWAA